MFGSKKLSLPQVTLVAVSSIKLRETIRALEVSMSGVEFHEVLLISHDTPMNLPADVKFKTCLRIDSSNAYSRFMAFELAAYIDSEFVLVVQHDGYILRPQKWDPHFMDYDYIGAPWPANVHFTQSGRNIRVGNGGFSLRSKKLLTALDTLHLPFTDQGTGYWHEDGIYSVYYRTELESAGLKFAPVDVASRFSHESDCPDSVVASFGFHNNRRVIPRFFSIQQRLIKLLSNQKRPV